MRTFLWPSEDGWPYPDGGAEVTDPADDIDYDLVSFKAPPPHLLDDLEPLEREVVTRHYGLNGVAPRTMKELHLEMGLSRAELRDALGAALTKLRVQLA